MKNKTNLKFKRSMIYFQNPWYRIQSNDKWRKNLKRDDADEVIFVRVEKREGNGDGARMLGWENELAALSQKVSLRSALRIGNVADGDSAVGQGSRLDLVFVLVGGGDGELRAIFVERQRGDRSVELVQLDDSLSVERIPDVDDSVGTTRRERSVLRVERDCVHRMDQFGSVGILLSVAFERVLSFDLLAGLLYILYGDTSFDRRHDEGFAGREELHGTGLVLEWTVTDLQRLAEFSAVVHENLAILGPHENRVLQHVHRVHAVGHCH